MSRTKRDQILDLVDVLMQIAETPAATAGASCCVDAAQIDRTLTKLRRDVELQNAGMHGIREWSEHKINQLELLGVDLAQQLVKVNNYLTNRDDVAAIALSLDSLRDRVTALEEIAKKARSD